MLSTVYQVIGGAGIPVLMSLGGLLIGGYLGIKDGSPQKVVMNGFTGASIGAFLAGALGVPAATKFKVAGITQVVVGVGLGAGFWWERDRGEGLLAVTLVPTGWRLGSPRSDR